MIFGAIFQDHFAGDERPLARSQGQAESMKAGLVGPAVVVGGRCGRGRAGLPPWADANRVEVRVRNVQQARR